MARASSGSGQRRTATTPTAPRDSTSLRSLVERGEGGREVAAIGATGEAEASRVAGCSDSGRVGDGHPQRWREVGFPLPLVHTNWRHAEAVLAAAVAATRQPRS